MVLESRDTEGFRSSANHGDVSFAASFACLMTRRGRSPSCHAGAAVSPAQNRARRSRPRPGPQMLWSRRAQPTTLASRSAQRSGVAPTPTLTGAARNPQKKRVPAERAEPSPGEELDRDDDRRARCAMYRKSCNRPSNNGVCTIDPNICRKACNRPGLPRFFARLTRYTVVRSTQAPE